MAFKLSLPWHQEDDPNLTVAIRRHGDRCFHEVEEKHQDGYVITGIFIDLSDVAEEVIQSKDDPDHSQRCIIQHQ